MSPKPLEPSREALPPSIPYYVPAGALITTIVVAIVMAGVQNPEYPCSAINAMCAERERREQVEKPVLTTALPAPVGASRLTLPDQPKPEWARSAARGCPPRYRLIKGACWIRVDEAPPCPTSYEYEGACLAPLEDRRPIGVSDFRGSP